MRVFVSSVSYTTADGDFKYRDFYIFSESLERAFKEIKTVYPDIEYIKEAKSYPYGSKEVSSTLCSFEFFQTYLGEKYRTLVLARDDEEAFVLYKQTCGGDVDIVSFYKLDEHIEPWGV